MIALVCTADSMSDVLAWDGHCVYLFESEEEATLFAVGKIVDAGMSQVIGNDGTPDTWEMGGERYADPSLLLTAFQDSLDITEYFHLKPVAKST